MKHKHKHTHTHILTAVGPFPGGRRSKGQEASSTHPLPPREELLSLPQEQGGGREKTTRATQILKVREGSRERERERGRGDIHALTY